MRAIGCLKSILCTVLGVYIWYYYTLGKRVQAYVLVYCPLGQRLVNVCMGGPPAFVLTKDRCVRTGVPPSAYILTKDRCVHIVLFSVHMVRNG
jgi:hypothetical protein